MAFKLRSVDRIFSIIKCWSYKDVKRSESEELDVELFSLGFKELFINIEDYITVSTFRRYDIKHFLKPNLVI